MKGKRDLRSISSSGRTINFFHPVSIAPLVHPMPRGHSAELLFGPYFLFIFCSCRSAVALFFLLFYRVSGSWAASKRAWKGESSFFYRHT